jgi:hypothetical protein
MILPTGATVALGDGETVSCSRIRARILGCTWSRSRWLRLRPPTQARVRAILNKLSLDGTIEHYDLASQVAGQVLAHFTQGPGVGAPRTRS